MRVSYVCSSIRAVFIWLLLFGGVFLANFNFFQISDTRGCHPSWYTSFGRKLKFPQKYCAKVDEIYLADFEKQASSYFRPTLFACKKWVGELKRGVV